MKRTLFFDIESHSATELWDLPPEQFFRLGQWAWGRDGEVHLTQDLEEMRSLVRSADLVVGQNVHSFDLTAIFGKDSTEPLEMALDNRILDTMVWANQAYPPPYSYSDRAGHTYYDAASPGKARKWLSLDNLSFALGLEGKIGDLKKMAKEYGGFCHIPLDNDEFLTYAKQDITALQQLAVRLLEFGPLTPYLWREQLNAAIDAQSSRNGLSVDLGAAYARVSELREQRDHHMSLLVERYDFPTTGKAPWSTTAGKDAIFKALADYGIPSDTLPKTATGNPSLGGQALIDVTRGRGAEAEQFGDALAELKGQRSLAALAIECTQADGKAHPSIDALQRSGRKSTTKPGLTVVTAHGPGAIEKRYYVASAGCKLVEMDLSQADQRIVAALSGDQAFAERFKPNVDAHMLAANMVFGEGTVAEDPGHYRRIAKACGHADAFRAGPRKIAETAGVEFATAKAFVDWMKRAYPQRLAWQERVTAEGDKGYVINDWGRRMIVEHGRSYNQSPALLGQSGTREIVVDALIRMAKEDIRYIQWLVIQVHDALVFDIPVVDLGWAVPRLRELFECSWGPSTGGQVMHFPVGVGEPADNWYEAGH